MVEPWENSVATQGDPCRDLNTLSQPQTLSQHKISVVTRGQKSLSRQRNPLSQTKPSSMPRNPIATQRSLSQHRARKLCRVLIALSRARPNSTHMFVVRAQAGSCAWPENPIATRKTMSRHKARETLSQHKFLCRNRGPKMGSSPLWSSYTSSFPFSFLSIHSNLNTQ